MCAAAIVLVEKTSLSPSESSTPMIHAVLPLSWKSIRGSPSLAVLFMAATVVPAEEVTVVPVNVGESSVPRPRLLAAPAAAPPSVCGRAGVPHGTGSPPGGLHAAAPVAPMSP